MYNNYQLIYIKGDIILNAIQRSIIAVLSAALATSLTGGVLSSIGTANTEKKLEKFLDDKDEYIRTEVSAEDVSEREYEYSRKLLGKNAVCFSFNTVNLKEDREESGIIALVYEDSNAKRLFEANPEIKEFKVVTNSPSVN